MLFFGLPNFAEFGPNPNHSALAEYGPRTILVRCRMRTEYVFFTGGVKHIVGPFTSIAERIITSDRIIEHRTSHNHKITSTVVIFRLTSIIRSSDCL